MAQLNFYGSWEDSFRILEDILRLPSPGVILDRPYPTSSAPGVVTALTPEVRRVVASRRRVFLVVGQTGPDAVRMMRVEEGRHHLHLDESLSCFSLTFPPCYVEGGHIHLSAGDLYRPARYWSATRQAFLPPAASVRGAFDRLKRLISGRLSTVKLGGKRIRVGLDGLRLLREGEARVRVGLSWFTAADLEGRPVKKGSPEKP